MANYQSAYTGAQIDTAVSKINDLLNIVYPVGSIYMSVNATSPETFIGGTWVRITDCFLLASGNTYAPGATGGEAQVTLSIDTMPSHNHNLVKEDGTVTSVIAWPENANAAEHINNTWGASAWPKVRAAGIGWTGGSQPHNNMPPYLAVYVWQRTS